MKTKLFLSALILSIFGIILYCQMPVVMAVAPMNRPISGPLPSVTPTPKPISSPISYFLLQGKVEYSSIKRSIPAVGVKVTAVNVIEKITISTQTDQKGNYVLKLPTKVMFNISAHDNTGTIFNPTSYVVSMIKDLRNYNFVGLLRP
jgi:hypothetical protein